MRARSKCFLIAVSVSLLLTGAARSYEPPTTGHVCRDPQPNDPARPMNYPDLYAWELFTQVNRKASAQHKVNGKETNNAVWETWADDPWTFPANPDPANPPKWPGEGEVVPKQIRPFAVGHANRAVRRAHGVESVPAGGGEEVRRNRETFDYIISNELWYTQGIAKFFAKGIPVDFPIASIEVKGNWVPIDEKDKPRYHWNIDANGKLYGLVAMHISSKALPNWFWSTFEWVDNPGRCDYIGGHDCYGYEPHDVPSNTDTVGKVYPGGTMTAELKALFQRSGFTGEWGAAWSHYRLKGSQVDYTDATGRPVLLGNSVTEGGFVQTASCMTCHARATVTAQGASGLPVFGEAQGLPLQSKTPGQYQTQFTTYNGTPDPSWYYVFTAGVPKLVNLQVDFVWAIPFRARPAK